MEKYDITCREKRSGTVFGGIYEGDLQSCIDQLNEDFPFFSAAADGSTRIYEIKPNGRRLKYL